MPTFSIITDKSSYEIRARNYIDALDIVSDKYDDDSYVDSVEEI